MESQKILAVSGVFSYIEDITLLIIVNNILSSFMDNPRSHLGRNFSYS